MLAANAKLKQGARGRTTMKVGVIMNPVAGGGRLKRHWPEIGAALQAAFGDFELRETQAAGDGSTLAMDLAANGCGLVIAAGGDGTLSEVADGLIKAGRGQQGCARHAALRDGHGFRQGDRSRR